MIPMRSTPSIGRGRMPAPMPAHAYRGSNVDRQSRFESRSARRWGDWGILAVATPLLWLEDEYAETVEDSLLDSAPPITDLWP